MLLLIIIVNSLYRNELKCLVCGSTKKVGVSINICDSCKSKCPNTSNVFTIFFLVYGITTTVYGITVNHHLYSHVKRVLPLIMNYNINYWRLKAYQLSGGRGVDL